MKWIIAILTRLAAIVLRAVVSKLLRNNDDLMALRPIAQAYAIKAALQAEFDLPKGASLVVYIRNGFPILFLRGVYGELHLIRIFV
ncbi:hypothetical protein [Achromobacter phage nyashin_LB6]|nr:hypothetical protein [Achromobacter phage nyashin_LB6]